MLNYGLEATPFKFFAFQASATAVEEPTALEQTSDYAGIKRFDTSSRPTPQRRWAQSTVLHDLVDDSDLGVASFIEVSHDMHTFDLHVLYFTALLFGIFGVVSSRECLPDYGKHLAKS